MHTYNTHAYTQYIHTHTTNVTILFVILTDKMKIMWENELSDVGEKYFLV